MLVDTKVTHRGEINFILKPNPDFFVIVGLYVDAFANLLLFSKQGSNFSKDKVIRKELICYIISLLKLARGVRIDQINPLCTFRRSVSLKMEKSHSAVKSGVMTRNSRAAFAEMHSMRYCKRWSGWLVTEIPHSHFWLECFLLAEFPEDLSSLTHFPKFSATLFFSCSRLLSFR